ncbi:MAG: ArsA family ATPase [Anaerolineae bacterium]
MRIILYTGKGGVGKTSVAVATALRCADLGYRTVVLSTDAAHSLADSFDAPLGAEPTPISSNLWGQEINVLHEMERYWGTVQAYMSSVFAWQGMDELMAEETSVFPGIGELASLIQIVRHHDRAEYDVIIVDCAPTSDTLRLLSFPEVARWYLRRIFPIERKVAQLARPVIRPFFNMPFPEDEVFEAIKDLLLKLDRMHTLLADPQKSSVRLVLNPEKMVIKEAQRTYTYLNLYGYPTDLVISNRLIPPGVQDTYFDAWKEAQERYGRLIHEAFAPLPVLKAPLFDQEVVGPQMLRRMAESIYGDGDPSQIYFQGRTHSIEKRDGHYVLSFPLPFVEKGDVDLIRHGDELVVQVGNFRRNLVLPHSLAALEVEGAKLEGELLNITFVKEEREAAVSGEGSG